MKRAALFWGAYGVFLGVLSALAGWDFCVGGFQYLSVLADMFVVGTLCFLTGWYATETARIAKETRRLAEYTKEMAEEMRRETALRYAPLLSVEVFQPELSVTLGDSFRKLVDCALLRAKNIGQGPAVNVVCTVASFGPDSVEETELFCLGVGASWPGADTEHSLMFEKPVLHNPTRPLYLAFTYEDQIQQRHYALFRRQYGRDDVTYVAHGPLEGNDNWQSQAKRDLAGRSRSEQCPSP